MKNFLKFSFAFFIFLLILLLFENKKLEKFELITYDWRLKNSTLKEDIPLVIVGITGDFEKEIGEPFSRKYYSKILKILKEEDAKIVIFDIFFPTFSEKNDEDLEFLKSIKENGKVVLPVFSPVKLEKRKGEIYIVDSIRGSAIQFENFALSTGHINTYQDKDQIIRRFPAYIKYREKIYPQIGIEVKRILSLKSELPLDNDGCFYIRYIPPNKIKDYFISFSDVIKKNYSKDFFKGKIVLIGQTIVGAKNADLIPTPFGTQFGVFIQASSIATNITGKYIKHINPLFYFFIYSIFLSLIFSNSRVFLNTIYTFFFPFLILFTSKIFMNRYGIFFDVIPFLFFTFFYYLAFIFYSLILTVKKLFQKETILKIVKNVEEEFTEILNPVESLKREDMSFLGFGSEELVEKTPSMVLKTILLTSGIECGCILIKSGKKIEIIAKEGKEIENIDIEEIIKDAKKPKIINKFKGNKIKSLAVIPIFIFSDFSVYGIFINKKPTIFSKKSKFTFEDINLIETLSLQGIIAIQNSKLNLILKETQLETIFRLAIAIEYRDRETGGHIQRVSNYAYLIGEKMGFKKTECNLIKNAMPLHDIGKIAIPDNILLKPEKLTDEERKIVEMHPVIGAKMLEGSKSIILKAAEIIALSHHEKYDGSGYPYGLSGNEIPIYGRIATLSDVFDALTSKRIYKEPVSIEEGFEIINEEKGKIFDPKIVEVFLKAKEEVIEIYNKFKQDNIYI
jgi:HD-GYP domain-containing protein (c-di-GMP phosphodiesterase class II)/CHASE2 domain-containing sensor protein